MLGKAGGVIYSYLRHKIVAFPVALHHLEKSGDHNDFEACVFEVLGEVLLYKHRAVNV